MPTMRIVLQDVDEPPVRCFSHDERGSADVAALFSGYAAAVDPRAYRYQMGGLRGCPRCRSVPLECATLTY